MPLLEPVPIPFPYGLPDGKVGGFGDFGGRGVKRHAEYSRAGRGQSAENGFGFMFWVFVLLCFCPLGLGPKLQSSTSEVSRVNLFLFS